MSKPRPKVPLEPLMDALRRAGIDTDGNQPVSLATGLHTRTIIRARKSGTLTTAAADRAATRALGFHPVEIWGDEWTQAT